MLGNGRKHCSAGESKLDMYQNPTAVHGVDYIVSFAAMYSSNNPCLAQRNMLLQVWFREQRIVLYANVIQSVVKTLSCKPGWEHHADTPTFCDVRLVLL